MSELPIKFEICIDHWGGALAAHLGGADRLEICGPLMAGGVTPSAGLIEQCVSLPNIETMLMIRPHNGDFVYDEHDVANMVRDIEWAHRLGVTGVVWGALTVQGVIDVPLCRQLVQASRPLAITFHRAFDCLGSLEEGLDTLIALGIDRVLTSGGETTAWEGREMLARLVERAAGRMVVMPGGGVNEQNARPLAEVTGARELHASASQPRQVHPSPTPVQFGIGTRQTSAARVRALRQSFFIE